MWVFLESDSVKWKKKKRFLWKNKQKILNELMRMLEELREREREREIFIENKIRRKRIKIKDIVKITKLFKSY